MSSGCRPGRESRTATSTSPSGRPRSASCRWAMPMACPRAASNAGPLFAAGRVRRIAGRVCMDQFVVDLGDDRRRSGDEVVLFGAGCRRRTDRRGLGDRPPARSPTRSSPGSAPRLPRTYIGAQEVGRDRAVGLTRTAAVVGASVGVAAAGAAVGVVDAADTSPRALSSCPTPTSTSRSALLRGTPVDGTHRRRRTAVRRGRRAHGVARRTASDHRALPRVRAQPRRAGTSSARLCAARPRRRVGPAIARPVAARGGQGPRQRAARPATSRRSSSQIVPDGPIVLIGHSMGGMTIIGAGRPAPRAVRCAHRRASAWSRPRRAAVARCRSCAAAPWAGSPTGRPRRSPRSSPATELVQHGRRARRRPRVRAHQEVLVRHRRADSIARFAADMIAKTPIDVVAQLLPRFDAYDAATGSRSLTACRRRSSVPTGPDHARRPQPAHGRAAAGGDLRGGAGQRPPGAARASRRGDRGICTELVERAAATVPERLVVVPDATVAATGGDRRTVDPRRVAPLLGTWDELTRAGDGLHGLRRAGRRPHAVVPGVRPSGADCCS